MMQIGFKCNTGVVRENNEDACFVIPNRGVYIVADGVGGNNSGEIASRTAVERIAEYVHGNDLKACDTPDDIFSFFSEAIKIANEEVFQLGNESDKNSGMATTLVVGYIRDDKAYISNVGDSRAYLFRTGKMKQLTDDHTYVNELVQQGLLTKDEAENHSQRNVITKALGAGSNVEADFYMVPVKKNDIIMLCTDGLYGEVNDEGILEVLNRDISMNEMCSELVDKAIKSGGRDNITVVCVKI